MHMPLFPRSIGLNPLPQTALSGWKEGQDIGLAWFLWRGRAGGPLKIGTSTWGSFSFLAWQKEFEGYQKGFEAWTFSWRGREVQGNPCKNVFKIVASTILTFVFDKPDLAVLWKMVLQNLFIYIYVHVCVCMWYVYICANVYSMYICVYAHVFVPLQEITGVTFVRVFFKTIPFHFFHRCGFLLPGNPTAVEPLSRTSVEAMCRQAESLEGRRMWTKIYTRFLVIHLTKLTTWKQLMGDMGHDVWLYCF